MPGITRPTYHGSDPFRIFGSEWMAPLPDGFVSDIHTTTDQNRLHIAETEFEAVVKPDGMLDDCAEVPKTAIVRTCFVHGFRLAFKPQLDSTLGNLCPPLFLWIFNPGQQKRFSGVSRIGI
jgi:hypothetical protein